MELILCSNHAKCGGQCNTSDERDAGLCDECREAKLLLDTQEDYLSQVDVAFDRIAKAANIGPATPAQIADFVSANLAS
ncbi:hypothetical protein A8H39_00740 [Paraburkholderia fungorum]|uniref:hypothetical protein n=1 Tax=Paraburkholderia fungorum TaxID=134537 RepID=UPI000482890E|nr:hypothetical protein [Paraburkholderia fungorum]PNE59707.1 hypothetical protein A8H39_00740 [Paraburkholderia fungorum]